MFYDQNEIFNILKCSLSETKAKEFKILPCGQTFCSTLEKGKTICICSELHSCPCDGFPTSESLCNLQCESFDLLIVNLEEIQSKIDLFTIYPKKGIDIIKEHCKCLKIEIKLASDHALQQIKDFNEDLINQIDNYEKDCINNFENNMENNRSPLINEMNEFKKRCNHYLKQMITTEKLALAAN